MPSESSNDDEKETMKSCRLYLQESTRTTYCTFLHWQKTCVIVPAACSCDRLWMTNHDNGVHVRIYYFIKSLSWSMMIDCISGRSILFSPSSHHVLFLSKLGTAPLCCNGTESSWSSNNTNYYHYYSTIPSSVTRSLLHNTTTVNKQYTVKTINTTSQQWWYIKSPITTTPCRVRLHSKEVLPHALGCSRVPSRTRRICLWPYAEWITLTDISIANKYCN